MKDGFAGCVEGMRPGPNRPNGRFPRPDDGTALRTLRGVGGGGSVGNDQGRFPFARTGRISGHARRLPAAPFRRWRARVSAVFGTTPARSSVSSDSCRDPHRPGVRRSPAAESADQVAVVRIHVRMVGSTPARALPGPCASSRRLGRPGMMRRAAPKIGPPKPAIDANRTPTPHFSRESDPASRRGGILPVRGVLTPTHCIEDGNGYDGAEAGEIGLPVTKAAAAESLQPREQSMRHPHDISSEIIKLPPWGLVDWTNFV